MSECRAARWKGTPCFEGAHEPHFFTYGPHGMYTGSCIGRSDPLSDAVDSPPMRVTDEAAYNLLERIADALEGIAESLGRVEGALGQNVAGEAFFKVVTGDKS